MIVRSRGLWLAAFLMLGAMPLAAQKVGYVNSQKILQEMPGVTAAQNRIRVELEALQRRQQVMVDSLNAMVTAIQRDSTTQSEVDRQAAILRAQAFEARLRDTVQVLEGEAQEAQAAAMQPLFDQIRLALEEIRATDGYAMIFDIGNQANAIVAMDRNLDISDKVLARIRSTASTGRPTTTPTTTPAATPPATSRPATTPAGPVAQPSGVGRRP